jgi:hypothetical protein
MKCFASVGLVAIATTLALGCSDDREPPPPATDAAATADAGVDASGDASSDVSIEAGRSDGFIDLFDVFPLPDAGCPACIRDRCGSQINACFINPACAQGLFCTLQMCLGGILDAGVGPAAYGCVLGCFNGDQATALTAIGSIQCLTMTCAGACNFLPEAGTIPMDVRPPPDAHADTSADATDDPTPDADTSADATDDTTPDSATPPDAIDTSDADGAPPPDDVASDAPSSDAPSSDAPTVDDATPDTPPSDDVTNDVNTPDVETDVNTPDVETAANAEDVETDAADDATTD